MRRSKNNSSKNMYFIVAAVVSVGVAALYFMFNGSSYKVNNLVAGSEQSGEVVAEVNGKPIYTSEAEKQFASMVQGSQNTSFSQLDDKAKFVVIREIAVQRMLLDEAYQKGFANKNSVQEKINALKNDIIKEEFLAQMAKDQVTEEAIKKRYEADSASLKDKSQFKIKHIIVKTESEAKKVKKVLKTKSFEQAAKDYSIDEKTSLTGGDLGYVIEGNMLPEVETAIKPLAAGEVSTPVKTPFGWHIIKLEEKTQAKAAPYEQVKNVLARALYQEAIQNYLQKALDKADIQIIAAISTKEEEATPDASKSDAATPEGDNGLVDPEIEANDAENNG